MNFDVLFFFAAIIIIGGVLFAMMGLTRKGTKNLDMDRYRAKWLAIETLLKRDDSTSCSLAVLNGDKLVDQALRERGLNGVTMAERMKAASTMLGNKNALWTAHKLRNQIAHEPDVRVTYEASRAALSGFKQALKDLRAI